MRVAAARIGSVGKPTPNFSSFTSKQTKSFQGITLLNYRQKYNWNASTGKRNFHFEPRQLAAKSFQLSKTDGASTSPFKWICLGSLLFAAADDDEEALQTRPRQQQQKTSQRKEDNNESSGNASKPPQGLGFKDLLVHSSMGTMVGFAVGYAARKSLKLLFVLLGGQFIMLQILQHLGYIEIKWGKVTDKVEEKWEHERHEMWDTFKAILTENVPFKGSNTKVHTTHRQGGFLAGMAWGFHFPV